MEAIRWGGLLESPELETRDGELFVFGNDVPIKEIPTTHDPFVAVELPEGDLGRPEGEFLFVSPRVALAPDGVLHMVWAEPGNPPDNDVWGRWTHRTLWHARHEATDGWSQPVELLRRDEIDWSGAMAVDSAGRIHIVVGTETRIDDEVATEALHLVGVGGGWEQTRLDSRSLLYPVLTAGANDRLYLTFIRAAGAGNPNSVFLRGSTDRGEGWETAEPVYLSGGRRAFDLNTLLSRDGRLHLVWRETGPSAGLRHIASSDAGRTWSEPDDVTIDAFMVLGIVTVVDSCGAIHVVYESVAPDGPGQVRPSLWYVRWQDGWTVPVELFPAVPQAFNPGLAIDGQGTPTLYFSGGYAPEPDSPQIGGFVSRLEVQR